MLHLPDDFIVPDKRPKRRPGPIDFDIFLGEQKVAVDAIIDYCDGRTPFAMMVLRGYAGTGKTFIVGKLQDFFLYARKYKVAVTTPTNKAVQVAKDMCEITDSNLTFTTLHKLLGLKEDYDDYGRLTFVPDPHNPPSLDGYDVLIIDEVSMLDDYLFGLIRPFINQGVKIIMVGDPAQIPPINKSDCIPFKKKEQLKHNMGVCDLTVVRRQSGENPILDFATAIRMQRMQENFDYDYQPLVNNGMGIIPIYKNAKDVMRAICETYFVNPIFDAYPDFMKIIAYNNKVVNGVNKQIRTLIYHSNELPMLMPGEKMLADEPIRTQEQATLHTNSEFVIRDFQIANTKYVGVYKDDVVVRQDFKYYHTTVEAMSDKGLRSYRMWIIHEDSMDDYRTSLAIFKQFVFTKYGFERKAAWREYYKLYNFFAKVKYNYAITAHKSQGSTYENAIMLDWNIYDNFKYQERNRIRYVAATRARKHLFVVK